MRIAFKFSYIHNNGLFTRILKRVKELSQIPVSLHQDGTEYTIVASGDQAALEALAELISILTPQSLFLAEYKIEQIEQDEKNRDKADSLLENDSEFEVPYCPECQKSVTDTFNPFNACSVCGTSEKTLTIEKLMAFTKITASTEDLFSQLANVLYEKGEITLPTYNGIRRFSLLTAKQQGDQGILVCDPSDISDKFLITEGELNALMMVEKPSVRLKPKLMFRSEHEMNKPFYPVFFADDKITLALAAALKDKGISTVFCDHVPTLRVASALDEHFIFTCGRDMLPWYIDKSLAHASFCEYNGFQAYGDHHGLQIDTQVHIDKGPFVRYVSNENKTDFPNAIHFEPAHAALRSIVVEHKLDNQSLCGIHLSRAHTSHIFSFSKKIGYTPMVLFSAEDLTQPKHMLEAIRTMDEGGSRLINNFQKSFPELYEKIQRVEFKSYAKITDIAKIWSLAAVFIGIYDGEDALESCEVLEATAIEFNGKSGPRIDYKVISTDEGYQLDPRLAIRSAMSFKLAGLDDHLLSFGFIDSLADFIAQQAENADANIGINGVTLSGGLFENRQLLMRTYNALSVNYTIYRNRRLSIDDANIALGAITLGSE